jgi:hypothetical protein
MSPFGRIRRAYLLNRGSGSLHSCNFADYTSTGTEPLKARIEGGCSLLGLLRLFVDIAQFKILECCISLKPE